MFDYIKSWMSKDSKKNDVLWNSAKVGSIKTNFLKPKNYVKKIILMLIGLLVVLIGLVKKLRGCLKGCRAI